MTDVISIIYARLNNVIEFDHGIRFALDMILNTLPVTVALLFRYDHQPGHDTDHLQQGKPVGSQPFP